MPSQSRQTPTTTTTTSATSEVTPPAPDLSNGVGNAARASDVSASGPESETSALDQEVTRPKEMRAGDVAAGAQRVTLAAGKSYVVTDKDMQDYEPWRAIARANGTTPERLQAFNQHVAEVNVGGTTEEMALPPTELAVGVEIYVPSAQELAFAEARRKAGSYEGAINLWGKMTQGPNVKMLDAANMRATGDVGESYGTQGVNGGNFYTPNPEVAGAKASHKVNGQQQYKVFWLANFWKCSIFMNDVVFQAGYKPAMMANKHYSTAGNAHKQPQYKTVKASEAMPGDGFQKFGGSGSDESHNAILSTFVDIKDLGDGTEEWKFNILGAENDRAAESEKEAIVDKATGTVVSGYGGGRILRFLRPVQKR